MQRADLVRVTARTENSLLGMRPCATVRWFLRDNSTRHRGDRVRVLARRRRQPAHSSSPCGARGLGACGVLWGPHPLCDETFCNLLTPRRCSLRRWPVGAAAARGRHAGSHRQQRLERHVLRSPARPPSSQPGRGGRAGEEAAGLHQAAARPAAAAHRRASVASRAAAVDRAEGPGLDVPRAACGCGAADRRPPPRPPAVHNAAAAAATASHSPASAQGGICAPVSPASQCPRPECGCRWRWRGR